MKKITFILLLFSFASQAQSPYDNLTSSRQKFKTGVGVAFSSTEAMWGYSMHSEYNYFLNKNISLTSGLAVMQFRDDTPDVLKNAQVESLEIGVALHLLENEDLSFHIGGGGNLRYFHWGIAVPVNSPVHTFDGEVIHSGTKKTLDQLTAGYSLNAAFGLKITPKMRLLFQEQLQNDKKNNITWDSRLALLFKF